MSYVAAPDRYQGKMQHRRCGRSRLDLPVSRSTTGTETLDDDWLSEETIERLAPSTT